MKGKSLPVSEKQGQRGLKTHGLDNSERASFVAFFLGLLVLLVTVDQFLGSIGPANHVRGANSLISEKIVEINSTSPEIVFFGTSVCSEGVDERLVEEMLGMRVAKNCGHIQRGAYYYLFLKNILLHPDVRDRPSIVAILFVFGTLTEIRETLNYGEEFYINSISIDDDDALLDALIYGADERSLIGLLKRYSFFLRKLEVYRRYIAEKFLLHESAELVTWRQDANKVFHRNAFLPVYYERQVAQVIQRVSEDHLGTFHSHINKTFLPEIVKLASDHEIKLVFVHMPINSRARVRFEKQNNDVYLTDLREYGDKNDIQVIDYSRSSEFSANHFPPADRVHLNALGRERFAELLNRDLKR